MKQIKTSITPNTFVYKARTIRVHFFHLSRGCDARPSRHPSALFRPRAAGGGFDVTERTGTRSDDREQGRNSADGCGEDRALLWLSSSELDTAVYPADLPRYRYISAAGRARPVSSGPRTAPRQPRRAAAAAAAGRPCHPAGRSGEPPMTPPGLRDPGYIGRTIHKFRTDKFEK